MLIIAHRGASTLAPENTLKAFTLAFEQQSDGIEFDTYQHDDAILVFHDKTLGRTTNGSGFLLQTSLADLKQLDAGDGEVIPTLEEVLATVPDGALCNIEVKHLRNAETWVQDVKRAVEDAQINPNALLISSFNHHWLAEISALWPQVAVGALTATYALDATYCARQLKAKSINIALDVVNADFVNAAKQEGLDVYVYTVDEPEDMLQLKLWGVTGIFTNVPDIAKQVVG